jgi:D-alanyl-D-alanine carboxypeptidase/D-alanyl-D-alanine-endopeptidase (penicillin-binding protein 4)
VRSIPGAWRWALAARISAAALAVCVVAPEPAPRASELGFRGSSSKPPPILTLQEPGPALQASTLAADLDRIFSDSILTRALLAVRVESLSSGDVIYSRNDGKLVMPGSNMKIPTLAVAVERLGWNFQHETRLEAAGTVAGGTLHGDLVVTGDGDPSIRSVNGGAAPLFREWAGALVAAGIRRVDGRLIGDDNAFDDEGLGAGWSWDYLGAGYAAPTSALTYNENLVTVKFSPGKNAGDRVRVEISPPGHALQVIDETRTGASGSTIELDVSRRSGSPRLVLRGSVPAGAASVTRTVSVDNPTRFFVEALRLALMERDVEVTGGAWDIDDASYPPAGERHVIARHQSPPLSELALDFMKTSQNFYAETLVKVLARGTGPRATADAGKNVIRQTLVGWGIPADAVVVYDGSGLSRYNYVTAGAITSILRLMWSDPKSRGPFAASLPVGGHDGTLDDRMKNTVLDARVQAKTGTISNVRALSGYLETQSGQRLVFSMIANHFTAPNAQIDAAMEHALIRLAQDR